jgi:sugar lactone lactonase YvrE
MDGGSGSLLAYRAADGRKLKLFPDPEAPAEATAPGEAWGAADCPGPPDPATFAPHGIDVDLRSHRLAAVVHGDREGVELFEIGQSPDGPVLVWRGCALAPEGAALNDVALLKGGGFVTTRMFTLGGFGQLTSTLRMIAGMSSGHLLEWSQADGFRQIPNSEGSAPNGLAVSRDGREIFFAEWNGLRVVRLRRDADGSVERRHVEVPHHPDNITWSRDGRLIVTGQQGPIGEVLACGATEAGTCKLPFSVVVVEPGTLDVTVVLEHAATAHGAGTTALQVGDELFIGTFDGDRLARVAFRP